MNDAEFRKIYNESYNEVRATFVDSLSTSQVELLIPRRISRGVAAPAIEEPLKAAAPAKIASEAVTARAFPKIKFSKKSRSKK